jgi:3-hydroxyethyl bacteriochlorophyllide a dehydrogenase
METMAVVLNQPEHVALTRLALTPPGESDVVVDIAWSGISTGTERLLFQGRMPPFPGLGYPLVPGYESVGHIAEGPRRGETVFVAGATCFGEVRGLFGGAASRLVVPSARAVPIEDHLAERGVLLALAATAQHAIAAPVLPGLIIGHGVLGRLLARLVIAAGGAPPTVWETNPARQAGAQDYPVLHPDHDTRRDYACICDASGDPALLDTLIGRLARGGEIILAGFYADRLSFAFPPAFMREVRLRVAAEWHKRDLDEVQRLLGANRLSLDGLVTHRAQPIEAAQAYQTAFTEPACLKMILDWSATA